MPEKKKEPFLKILNPKNLQKNVHMFGYDFSFKTHMLLLVGTLMAMVVLGLIFKLKALPMLIILTASIILLPYLILNTYKRMYEQKRFSDVLTYIEQMMYSFQKSEKILDALKECSEAFQPGEMKKAIDDAVTYIEKGQSRTEKGILREALYGIEEIYSNRRIHSMHELLINAEEDGGETRNSIRLILEDTEAWKRRIYKLQAEKKQNHTDNIFSIIVATALCAAALYVLDYTKVMFNTSISTDLFQNTVIQITSTAFILFAMFTFTKSQGCLTNDWIRDDGIYDNDKLKKDYDEVTHYNKNIEKKKSIIWAAPFLIAVLPVYIFGNHWVCIILLAIAAFLLQQHNIGHNIQLKDVTDALYIAFPEWLMNMALLLQNNNVQVSIVKSTENVPAVMEGELQLLIERIKAEPRNLSSYTGFCARFNIPESQSVMKMLYSISEAGIGDAEVQIANLLGHINKMQEQAEKIEDEKISFNMKMLFMYPVVSTSVKMLIDMTIGMFFLMSILGSVGA